MLSLALIAAFLLQDASPPEEVYLTVGENGRALVREVRSIQLTAGENQIRLFDVSPRLLPETLHVRSLTAPGEMNLRQQEFRFKVFDRVEALESLVGRDVRLIRHHAYGNEIIQGQLQLAPTAAGPGGVKPVPLVLSTPDGQVQVFGDGEPLLDGFTASEWNRPVLAWKVASSRNEKHRFEVTYQTEGFSQQVHYSLRLLEGNRGDFRGVVRMGNETGVRWNPLRILLSTPSAPLRSARDRVTPAESELPDYPIAGATSLPARTATEIVFITAPAIELRPVTCVFLPPSSEVPPSADIPIWQAVEFVAAEGRALPPGPLDVIRVDREGRPTAAGQVPLGGVPPGGIVTAPVGRLAGTAASLRLHKTATAERETEVVLFNDRSEALLVQLLQPLQVGERIEAASTAASVPQPGYAQFSTGVPPASSVRLSYRLVRK